MSGALSLLPLRAFVAWTETTLFIFYYTASSKYEQSAVDDAT